MKSYTIRMILPCLAVVILTSSTLAKPVAWKQVYSGPDGVDYIDVNNIKREGDDYLVTSLVDYSIPMKTNNGPIGSIIATDRYICGNRTYDTLKVTYYSDKLARGSKQESQFTPPKGISVIANTPAEAKFNYVCGKQDINQTDNTYQDRFNASGYLIRSAVVCNRDMTKTAEVAARIISDTPELQKVNKTEQAKQWGIDGAVRFNLDHDKLGHQAACDNALSILKQLQ